MNWLRERGIERDTLVLFLTDNGPDTQRYTAGLRGKKGDVYEGGIRTHLLASWPGRVPAGRVVDRIAAHIDLLPTILDACGVAPPAGLRLDGRSLLPLLRSDEVDWPEQTLFFQAHRGNVPVRFHHIAVRQDRWKLVHQSGFGRESFAGEPRFELYDLTRDPAEQHDLAAGEPDVVAALRARYEAWFDDVSRTRPDNWAPPRIVVGTEHENPTVLTRQDWRHEAGAPWARDSNGAWELRVGATGDYNVTLRFPAGEGEGRATLAFGELVVRQDLADGAETAVFKGLALAPGEARLRATLTFGEKEHGPMFVEVARR